MLLHKSAVASCSDTMISDIHFVGAKQITFVLNVTAFEMLITAKTGAPTLRFVVRDSFDHVQRQRPNARIDSVAAVFAWFYGSMRRHCAPSVRKTIYTTNALEV
ncbi:hypothetical protein [Bradyrhizobium sp. SSUT77]|uniref:hypothetical protein n=1 Tax=Bradyrhizobium sp. SSUT77 TaxID=3040603 RepID=UPI00244C94B2|nr:hypothetical protein [Bradyrhizobium sp. SSUT77]MDH2348382.1 hypothetical protein [Bradyrhizobium sp. SSUT77]